MHLARAVVSEHIQERLVSEHALLVQIALRLLVTTVDVLIVHCEVSVLLLIFAVHGLPSPLGGGSLKEPILKIVRALYPRLPLARLEFRDLVLTFLLILRS